jgi:hypothetical protein
VRQFLLTNLKRDATGDGYSFRIPFETLGGSLEKLGQFDFVPGVDKFDGKALFIRGIKSKYIQEKEIDAIRSFFPQARIESLNTGHWGMLFASLCLLVCMLVCSFVIFVFVTGWEWIWSMCRQIEDKQGMQT